MAASWSARGSGASCAVRPAPECSSPRPFRSGQLHPCAGISGGQNVGPSSTLLNSIPTWQRGDRLGVEQRWDLVGSQLLCWQFVAALELQGIMPCARSGLNHRPCARSPANGIWLFCIPQPANSIVLLAPVQIATFCDRLEGLEATRWRNSCPSDHLQAPLQIAYSSLSTPLALPLAL